MYILFVIKTIYILQKNYGLEFMDYCVAINLEIRYEEKAKHITLKLSDNLNCIVLSVWQKGEPIFIILDIKPK